MLIEKLRSKVEVHKLLAKLSGQRKAPATAIKLINDKYIHQEPITGIKSKNEDYFITMEIERTITYKNQRNKDYEVDDKVIKSIKVKAKNENDAKQKAKINVDVFGFCGTNVDSVEEICSKNKKINFIDVINQSTLKPVAPDMQWLEASHPT